MVQGLVSIVLLVALTYASADPPASMKYGHGHYPPAVQTSTYHKPYNYLTRPMHKGCLTPHIKYGSYYPTMSGQYCGVNTVVHFSCKDGYQLKGSKTATCMYGGHWNPPHHAVCHLVPKYCSAPAALLYGSYGPKLNNYHTGSVCHYKCHKGYYMVGHSSSVCMSKGYWSQQPGKCHDIDECTKYGNICGYNAVCKNTQGSYVCACKVGYKKINGKCQGHSCGVPVLTEYCTYGPSHQTTWDEGQNIHFKCPPGYEMHGQGTATCHNGKWSYPSPICKKKSFCYVPTMSKYCTYSPKHQNSWKIGHKITFHCFDGYEMDGHSYSTCKSDGTWDHTPPQCYKPKVCYVPVMPQYCSYKPHYQKSWNIGHKIHFSCPTGYDLKGHSYATCSPDGKWDHYPPACIKHVVCYKPTMPAHCSYKPYYQMTWYIGQKITFHCNSGYKMKGHGYATCKDDGQWDNYAPTCYREVCHLPVLPDQCSYAPAYQKSWYVGHKISYFCPAGYQVKGYKYATCLYGGKWSHSPPQCYRLACKPPPLTPHCSYATGYHKSTYGYGEKVAYKCHSNYVMLGNAYGVCMESGYWSTPAPKCYKPTYCHAPVMKNNCRLTSPMKSKYSPGHIIGFACPYGFLMKGYRASKCLYSGRWSHPPPLCYRKSYGYNYMHHKRW